ncbi:MAG: Crp/Fnr family transcriptional regulator [Desulfobacterales bacterium]|nr:Crp/Fnr family transcriptional regulator [Desulfobacterales bacterium]
MAILEGAPRSATAMAVDTVKVLEFNRANFEVLMMGNPQIALRLLKLFTKRIYDQKRRFMILTLDDPQAKIADVFLMLDETQAVATGGAEQDGEKREFKVTIEDVAHWAGMSRLGGPDHPGPLRQPDAGWNSIPTGSWSGTSATSRGS